MKKKIASELMSIAHSILKMKDPEDVYFLKDKAYQIYEKLTVLSFIEDFVKETPENTKTVEHLVDEVFKSSEKEQPEVLNVIAEKEQDKVAPLDFSLNKEFLDEVSLDVTTDIFENAERVAVSKSINDTISKKKNLQIDLNDRIAFVKHLFEESQEDFNRVVSQLNSMSSEKESLDFLKMIKKEQNWTGKEAYEDRLILLITKKFN